jgi:hypothetical protein
MMDASPLTPFHEAAISADAPKSEPAQPGETKATETFPQRERESLSLPPRSRTWPIVALLVGSHLLCGVAGFFLAGLLPRSQSPWIKEVAEHFLNAFVNENTIAARAVSTRAYQKEITAIRTTGGPLRWTITSCEVNERDGHASVKGFMVGPNAEPGAERRTFTLMMETEEGRWKVSSFSWGAFEALEGR